MTKYFISLLFLISLISYELEASPKNVKKATQKAASRKKLTVNIISRKLTNGAGKEVDVQILERELKRLGHHVNTYDYTNPPVSSHDSESIDESNSEKISDPSNHPPHVPQADINIFLAQFRTELFPMAKLNWIIPNAEFCLATPEQLKNFDLILCKTKEALRIFEPLGKTYFLGFTTIDRYQPQMAKRKSFKHFLHVAGKSRMKGTRAVVEAWNHHPEFPELVLIRHFSADSPTGENVELISQRIESKSLLKLQNKIGFHLCPSKTEGFGHSLVEAMSVGSIVITTDAPPMNEFIKDKRCLVKCRSSEKRHYATTFSVDIEELEKVVANLLELPVTQLKAIGQKNRKEFLKLNNQFRKRFLELMQNTCKEFAAEN